MDWALKSLEILRKNIKERQDQAIRDGDFALAEVLLDIREKSLLEAIALCEVQE